MVAAAAGQAELEGVGAQGARGVVALARGMVVAPTELVVLVARVEQALANRVWTVYRPASRSRHRPKTRE